MNQQQLELGWSKLDTNRILHSDCLELFRAAKRLIDQPKKWVQGKGAVLKSGKHVRSTHPRACAYCLSSAMQLGSLGYSLECVYIANRILDNTLGEVGFARTMGPPMVIAFNDYHKTTHLKVMDLLDRCIKHCNEVIDNAQKETTP